MKKIIISTKPPEEYKKFLKSKDNQNINGGLANLAEEGSLRRIDSNAEESDGKVSNMAVFWRHKTMVFESQKS